MADAKTTTISLAALMCGFCFASVTYAQSSRELINDCLKALADGDVGIIKEKSDEVKQLRGFEMPDVRDRIDATMCLNKSTGEAWQYWPGANRIVPKSMISALNDTKKATEEAARAFEYANNEAIASDIFRSCNELYIADKIAAITNETCIAVFQDNHHPSLPSEAKFVEEYVGSVFADFSEDEVRFIMDVTQN